MDIQTWAVGIDPCASCGEPSTCFAPNYDEEPYCETCAAATDEANGIEPIRLTLRPVLEMGIEFWALKDLLGMTLLFFSREQARTYTYRLPNQE